MKTIQQTTKAAGLLIIVAVFSGCAQTRLAISQRWTPSSTARVAVMPFAADDIHTGLIFGEGLADALVMELVGEGFPVMERRDLSQVLKEHALGYSGVVDQRTAVEIGKLSGIDYVVLGTLTTRTAMGPIEYFFGDGIGHPEVDTVRMRMVEIKTGQVMVSAVVENSRGGSVEDIAKEFVLRMGEEVRMKTGTPADRPALVQDQPLAFAR